jgi:drug/metabolite transporter (DMT)-like permease
MIGVLWSLAMAGLFGFSQLASRKGLRGIAVDQGTFIMIVVSTALMTIPFFWLGGPRLIQQSDPLSLAYFVLAGVIHFVGGFTLMNISIRNIGAARTGSLIATTPLFATFLAAISLHELINGPLVIGVLIVIAGVLLISSKSINSGSAETKNEPEQAKDLRKARGDILSFRYPGTLEFSGILDQARESSFGLLAALSWGLSPILIKKGLQGLPSPLVGLTLAMASAGTVYAVILASRNRFRPLLSKLSDRPALWQTAAGALVGLGTLCRWIALSFTTAAMVTTLSRGSLLITVGLGSTLLGRELEPVNNRVRLGAVFIVIGAVVVVFFGRS